MTDLEIYDKAVYTYLSTISDKVIYSITSQAFQNMGKGAKYKDYIDYSMISFYREPNIDIDDSRYQFSVAVFGDHTKLVQHSDGSREAQYVNSIPVNLTYQIDVWSAKNVNVQETATRLISKIYMENQILVAPMNPEGEYARFHITNVEWMDNSDLEAENDKGKLYRHTVSITISANIKLSNIVPTTEFRCGFVDIYNDEEQGEVI